MTAPRLVLLSLTALALATPAAHASTVGVAAGPPEIAGDVVFPGPDVLTYAAAPGEVNQLTLTRDDTALLVSDPGAVVEPGKGCTASDAHTVRCVPVADKLEAAVLTFDDGDDTLDATTVAPMRRIAVKGGPGNDTLRTGVGNDTLDGEDGDDVLDAGENADDLDGGPGTDVVRAGLGYDAIADGDTTPDVLDGGADAVDPEFGGLNSVTFAGRSTPLQVDLTAGTTSDGDRLIGITSATGGPGDDVLRGTADVNVLDGAGGDDTLVGGPGADRLIGGPGADAVTCGGGRDTVDDPDARVPPVCELLRLTSGRFSYLLESQPKRVRDGRVTFRLSCAQGPVVFPLGRQLAPCAGRLELRAGGVELGTKAFDGGTSQAPFDVKVTLRKPSRRVRTVTLAITGKAPHASWQIALRA